MSKAVALALFLMLTSLVFLQWLGPNIQNAYAQAQDICTEQYGQRCITHKVSKCEFDTCDPFVPPEDQPYCGQNRCTFARTVTECTSCVLESSTGESESGPGIPCIASFAWEQCSGNSITNACTLYNDANYRASTIVCGDVCTTGAWTNQTCGGGSCSPTEMYQTRTTNPSACTSGTRCVADPTCGGVAPYCGDGSANQSSEQCDLGAGNGPFPSTCSATCQINSPPSGGSYCGDGNLDSSYTINRAISTGNDDGYSSNNSVFDRTKTYGLSGEDNNTSFT